VLHLMSGQLADVPDGDEWLSTTERAVLDTLRLQKRRNDWRLGRWLARRAVVAALPAAPADFVVVAAADGAPEAGGLDSPVALSISHRHGRGLAVAALGDSPIGCDLELIEPRSDRFVRDWLTEREGTRVLAAADAARSLLANLCWSAKESASKVLRVGLRFDTRSFDVELPALATTFDASTSWQPLSVKAVKNDAVFVGAWRVAAGFVETVLAETLFVILEGDGEREAEKGMGTG